MIAARKTTYRKGVMKTKSQTSTVLDSQALSYSSHPKLGTALLSSMATREDLSLAYTPGIAEVSKLLEQKPDARFTHTFCRNNLAVISNGTAVLGLGNIGHIASYPVMEGKAMLFKRFGNVDAIPIVIPFQEIDAFVDAVVAIADSFGAINLEDIAAPACFEIEQKLKQRLQIPIMHDDQHGTAVVVLAAIQNALHLIPHQGMDSKIVLLGAGSAGIAIANLLLHMGYKNLVMVDSKGVVTSSRTDIDQYKKAVVTAAQPHDVEGGLAEALEGADIFIGVSKANMLSPDLVKRMATQPIVIAMANPIPEIMPADAKAAGVGLIATGRSDFPNQVNNALAFPGIFRGAIDARAQISEAMKLAAVAAIAGYHEKQLSKDSLLPSIMDEQVHQAVAQAVFAAATEQK